MFMEYLYPAIGFTFAAILIVFLILMALRYLKKNVRFDRRILVALCAIAFVVNYIGIVWDADARGWNLFLFHYYAVVRSVFNMACLFVFRDNYSSMGKLGNEPIFRACYYTVNACVFVIYGLLLLMLISWKFTSYLKVKSAPASKIFYFTSVNEESLSLARSIKETCRKKGERVLILFSGERLKKNSLSDQLYQKLIREGFLFFEYAAIGRAAPECDEHVNYQTYVDRGQKDFLRRIGIPKRHIRQGVKVFAFDEDQRKNIFFVLNEHHTFRIEGFGNVRFYVRVGNTREMPMLKNKVYIRRMSDHDERIEDLRGYEDVRMVCPYQLVADQFIEENRPYELVPRNFISADGTSDFDFAMGLLGSGKTGSAILKNVYTTIQNRSLRFRADIFDNRLVSEKGLFEFRYRTMKEEANLKLYPFSVYNEMLSPEILTKFLDYRLIVIALGNDEKNVEIANIVIRSLQDADFQGLLTHPIRLAVSILDKKNEIYLLRGNERIDVRAFGSLGEIYTYDIIINEILNDRAQIINYCYVKLYENRDLIARVQSEKGDVRQLSAYLHDILQEPDLKAQAEDLWDRASYFDRESSISSAQHLETKLYFSGYKKSDRPFVDYVRAHPDLMEHLAESEHLRWNAFYFSHDWSKLEYVPGGKRKDENLQKHICLVSWKELDELSEKTKINYKALDYMYLALMELLEKE